MNIVEILGNRNQVIMLKIHTYTLTGRATRKNWLYVYFQN